MSSHDEQPGVVCVYPVDSACSLATAVRAPPWPFHSSRTVGPVLNEKWTARM